MRDERRGNELASGAGVDSSAPLIVAPVFIALLVLATSGFAVLSLMFGAEDATFLTVVMAGIVSIFLAISRSFVGLFVLLVSMSAVQRMLATVVQSEISLWLDDVVLIGLALIVVITIRAWATKRLALIVSVIALLLLAAIVRAPSVTLGIYQARQVAVPILLVLFGFAFARAGRRVKQGANLVLTVGALAAAYGIFEALSGPLVDPALAQGTSDFQTENLRGGLPANYLYFLNDAGDFVVRIGGNLLNPPSFGLFMATMVLWVIATSRGHVSPSRVVLITLFSLCTVLTISRGGILLLVLALAQPYLTKKLGRFSFLILLAGIGYVAFNEFTSYGRSESHVEGLIEGVRLAATNPIGPGFGSVGNAVANIVSDGNVEGESLAAIFLSGTGWIGLAMLGWLLWVGLRSGGSVFGAAIMGATLNCMLSETSGGLDASGPLWILVGISLVVVHFQRAIASDRAGGKLILSTYSEYEIASVRS